ncbi:MAG TPA: magnesium transporter CorA family protein [Bacteroidales bacterium]|nr:magnesium transporter CorA family protein [Bacteroidales bacterium]
MVDTVKIGTLKWHHIVSPSEHDLQYLKDNFHFHPLDIEDCRSTNQRPKIDIYDDYYFIILHFPSFDLHNRFLTIKEVKLFWGEDYVISIDQTNWIVTEMFNDARKLIASKEEIEIGTSDALLYRILEKLMNSSLNLMRRLGLELDRINEDLFSIRAQKTIMQISITRKNIILVNTIFKPQLPLFHKFESGQIAGFAENMEEYWGNILDYNQKMWDMAEDYQELIEGLSKTFDSLQTNRINDIMKTLTFFSAILLPLTFITGLYGMNIGLPLQNDSRSFLIIIGLMMMVVITMLVYFKRRKWL